MKTRCGRWTTALLAAADPELSAQHRIALIADATMTGSEHHMSPAEPEIDRRVSTAVHAFLHGYLPR